MNWKDLGTRVLGSLVGGALTGLGAWGTNPAIGLKGAAAAGAVSAVGLAGYGATHTSAGSTTTDAPK